ncbi:MAG: hypothetical protein J6U57_02145 [Bacteroidales bacterium]|nr:hypothetical protein [Bacteroidales bacterium]
MKKIFTLVAAALMVAGLNAQELGTIDAAAAGIVEGGSVLAADVVLAQSASVTMAVGAEDTWKTNSGEANGMKNAIVGEASLALAAGVQGSNNPKDASGGNCDQNATVPASGAFVTFKVAKDGYLYVFHKASSNKTYLVGEEGSLIGYQFAAHMPGKEWGDILAYTLEGNETIDGIQYVTDPALLIWPERIALGEAKWTEITEALVAAGGKAQIGASGAGVIKFPVFADCKYTANACGSKIMIAGFIFSETDIETVKLSGDEGEVVLMGSGTNALENVAASVVSSRYYLLSGEEVAAPQAGNTGLYIVKNIMSDGSVNVSKVVLK